MQHRPMAHVTIVIDSDTTYVHADVWRLNGGKMGQIDFVSVLYNCWLFTIPCSVVGNERLQHLF